MPGTGLGCAGLASELCTGMRAVSQGSRPSCWMSLSAVSLQEPTSNSCCNFWLARHAGLW